MNGPALPFRPDIRAVANGLFLPLLFWTGAVIVVTLSGYPGVACMTPLAWLLALPVGRQIAQDSENTRKFAVLEAAAGGALLGFWQGLLFAAAMAATPFVDPSTAAEDLPVPWLVALVACLVSMPFTAALAAVMAWVTRRKS